MATWSRRSVLAGLGASPMVSGVGHAAVAVRQRSRVIVDNDFHGDPDGLVQLAHQLLSPGSEVRAIVASRLPAFTPEDRQQGQTARGVAKVAELLGAMGMVGRQGAVAGADGALASPAPPRTAATDAIIVEALRADTSLPLYYAAGAGLTDLATAWLIEPRIGQRLTLIWIGGGEYPDLTTAPIDPAREFNLGVDPWAAKVVFEQSDIAIWQVPRNVYRQMLFSHAELDHDLRACGRLGRYLVGELEAFMTFAERLQPGGLGETAILGDSPLVTLSALQSSFSPDASSSRYVIRPTPGFADDGRYVDRPGARPMRVFTQIDTRLTFGDMLAKFRAWSPARPVP